MWKSGIKILILSAILIAVFSCSAYAQRGRTYISLQEALKNPEDVYILDLTKRTYGTLSPDIGKLVNLEQLYLEKNGLSKLPPEIGNLKMLTILDVDQNSLTSIPPEIGNLTNLVELDIDQNYIRVLPPEIGNLIHLESFDLHSNQIRSLPAEIGKLTALKDINLTGNPIDTIPPEFNNLSELTSLVLTKVKYISSIGNLQKLKSLSFYDCRFTSLPSDLGKLKNLTLLKVFGCKIKFLPAGFGELISLEDLDLQHNEIDILPSEIGQLTSLKRLFLQNNKLKLIPKEIGNLKKLNQLRISNNLLDSLPNEIGNLTELIVLEIENNKLTSIPLSLEKLKKITGFNFRKNNIKTLSPAIGKFTHLTYLNLSENKLTQLPSEIGELIHVTTLYLNNNSLTSLPSSLGKLDSIIVLYLENNQLTSLPAEIGNLVNLKILDITNNKLTTFPKEIGKLRSLNTLYASKNRLTLLPSEFGDLSKLGRLELQNNKIVKLPNHFCQLSNLHELNLDSNRITALPDSMETMINLYELKLRSNLLSGLPTGLGNCNNLVRLDLFNNPFSTILKPLAEIKNLEYLNLARKHLRLLPVEILNHDKLESIDVDEDKYVDISYLSDMLVNNTSVSPSEKAALRKTLWMDKIISGIENNKSVECWECNGKYEQALLLGLKGAATYNELLELLKNEDPFLAAYAFKALEQNNYPELYPLILAYLFDERKLNFIDREWFSVGDIVATSPRLSSAQKKEVDSLLLYTVNNLSTTKNIISQLKPEERYHDRIAQLASKHPEALYLLVQYKRDDDVKIIEQGILNYPYKNLEAITQFPHPHFKGTIDTLKARKKFYMGDFAKSIAVYRDSFALNYFTDFFENYPNNDQNRSILYAMEKYPSAVYKDLMFQLAEKYSDRVGEKLFSNMVSYDLVRSTDFAKTGLKEDHLFLSENQLEMYIDHLLIYSADSVKKIIAGIILQGETERTELENPLNRRNDFTNYNRNYVKMSFFLNQAQRFKDENVANALLSFLENVQLAEGYNTGIRRPVYNSNSYEKEISHIILSYDEDEWIMRLIKILSKKKYIRSWYVDEMKENFEKCGWLDELASATKLYSDNYSGSWKIISYSDSNENKYKAPYWAEIDIYRGTTFNLQFCNYWGTGTYENSQNNTILFQTGDQKEFMYDNMIATSAAPEIRSYADWYGLNKKDSLEYRFYENNFAKILNSVRSYKITDSIMMLTGNGIEIKLKLADSWYTDWRKKEKKAIKQTNNYADYRTHDPDTGKIIKRKPQVIAGKPVAYFLAHPGIDKNSKLFIQGKLAIRDHDENWNENVIVEAMIDSLHTKNPETFGFYLYQFHKIMEVSSGKDYHYYNVVNWIETACIKFFLDDPFRFFKLIKYGEYKNHFFTWQLHLLDKLWDKDSEELMKEGIKYRIGKDWPAYVKDWDQLIEWMENYEPESSGRG